jgi:tetratricopeptide (TPR) repeat protein
MRTGETCLTLVLVAVVAACATNGPPPAEVYQGGERSDRYQDESAALAAWANIFQDRDRMFVEAMSLREGYRTGRYFVKTFMLQLRTRGFADDYFVVESQKGQTLRIRLQDMPNPLRVLQIQPGLDGTKYIVVVSDDLALVPDRPRNDPTYSRQTAQTMADILSTIRELTNESILSDREWQRIVNEYASNKTRPSITEDMRRYGVEAEALIRQQRFSDAAKSYAEALKRWPWWSQARYNRALVLGELKRYKYAAKEMTRYLQLEPNTSDRRRLQDQIYEWEAYARR